LKTPRAVPIRIAFCITELEPGGAERCLVELVTRLDPARFTPEIYCLAPRPVGKAALLADRLEQSRISVVYLGARSFRQAPRVVWQLRRLLTQSRPEILQTFLFHANVLGATAARLAGVPIVVTGIRVAERRAAWRLAAERWTARWVTRHVCVSQGVREFSARAAGLSPDKLVVIPNGVDVERFATAAPCRLESLGVTPPRRFIVYVGRIDVQKDVEALVTEIYSPERFPEHDLVLVGDGPQRQALERAVAQSASAERIHFAGYREDVAQIMAASDLLVLPSRWEGMPNVVLEAMAAARPVVATDVEGVAEALGPLAADQVVGRAAKDSGNHEWCAAFAEKMRVILADSQLAARLGRENQARVKPHFTHDAMVRAYERLYLDLLAAKA
jgi:glycosyltransferase involved in cell wall biosynthesis